MKINVLVTGAGSGGGENLINSLRQSDLNLFIYGSNMDEYLLAKSSADKTVWLPSAKEERYIRSLESLIKKEKIKLVIPNNDTEVGRISKDRDSLSCKVFLPPDETISICQDKMKMHKEFEEAGVPQAKFRGIECYDDIQEFISVNQFDKYWVRPRRGSGSMGATWVKTASQAQAWIEMWVELRGFSIDDFIISEFLPGKDYAFQSVWKNGELIIGKMIQRLSYYMGRNRLSNMSSTPAVAKTIYDEEALKNIYKAINTVSRRPHGNYNLDLKERSDGTMCITEFNIGRFCMITPIFDLTGKYNTAEAHVKAALDLPITIENSIDIENGVYLIRELDTLPTIVREEELKSIINAAR